MINTNKRFIGQVDNNNFRVISSGKRGILCILEGKIELAEGKKNEIIIETKLHKAFLILFIV